jgi:predicted CXXCH cytochrome family protein
MAEYRIPTKQFAQYSKSVHASALIDRHDLAAPTCNDCHGNHGARPPGIDSVASVCGQCHRQESQLFSKSPHAKAFQEIGLAGCVVCHDNHEIKKPDDRMLGVQGDAVCTPCHADTDVAPKIRSIQFSVLNLRLQIERTSEVLVRAERAGMEVSKPKFDLGEANAELVKARVFVHGFDPAKMTEVTGPAMKTVAGVHKAADAALDELAFRRRGLGYALIGIGVMIVALVLKIREIER